KLGWKNYAAANDRPTSSANAAQVQPGSLERPTQNQDAAAVGGELRPSQAQSNQAVKPPGQSEELLPAEANLVYYVNRERARFGLPPLKVCPQLQRSARKHCRWMAATGILQHTLDPVAENIAMGYETSQKAVAGWMTSPGHRANILGPYTYIGAAGYQSASGTPFWCLQFRR
ncbi:MAG: CAP domain-containing protein, partial [Thermoguttaceae bacterium]|nr:CAP domain-containing protein [Thermoguttaceae bacterium]